MARLLIYDAYENKVYTYANLNENDPMPYSTVTTLRVREFRGKSASPTLWTTIAAMEAWNLTRRRYGTGIPVGYAFKRIWEGGHGTRSQHCFTRRAAPKRGIWPIAWSIITRAPPAGIPGRPGKRRAKPPFLPGLRRRHGGPCCPKAARARPFCSTPPPANCWPCAPARALPGATTNFLYAARAPSPSSTPLPETQKCRPSGRPSHIELLAVQMENAQKFQMVAINRINCSCYRRHPHSDLTIFLDCFSKYSAIHLHSLLHQTQA